MEDIHVKHDVRISGEGMARHYDKPGGHYTVNYVRGDGMGFLRDYFADGPNELNWLFLGTSGVHGSYQSLDEIEAEWGNPDGVREITFTIFCPRMVRSYYGNAGVKDAEDIAWLREIASKTIDAIRELESGSIYGGQG